MSEEKETPTNKTTVRMMIAFIIILIIGIALRWEYISTEIAGAWKGIFGE